MRDVGRHDNAMVLPGPVLWDQLLGGEGRRHLGCAVRDPVEIVRCDDLTSEEEMGHVVEGQSIAGQLADRETIGRSQSRKGDVLCS